MLYCFSELCYVYLCIAVKFSAVLEQSIDTESLDALYRRSKEQPAATAYSIFYTVWNLTLAIRSEYSTSPYQHCSERRFPVCSYRISRILTLANRYLSESDGSSPDVDEFVRALQSVYVTKSVC